MAWFYNHEFIDKQKINPLCKNKLREIVFVVTNLHT